MKNGSADRCTCALAMCLGAGIAAPAIGAESAVREVHAQEFLGHFYIKMATGEAVFTPAREYLANKAGLRALGDDLTGDGVGDVWVAVNSDHCGLGTPTTPNAVIVAIDSESAQGDIHLYKAHSDSGDLRVESLTWSHWTDVVDTDADSDTIPDGNTRGHGFELTFWDREDTFGLTSSAAPLGRTRTASFSFTNMPGPLTAPAPSYMSGFILTFDLTGFEFELADTDGFGPATGAFTPFVGADLDNDTVADDDHDADGWHNWSVSARAIQPSAPGPNEGLIGYQLAAPGIPGVPNTGNPNDGVIDHVGEIMLRSSIVEPMGVTGIPTTAVANGFIARYSAFNPAAGTDPDPAGVSGGLPSSDFMAWGFTNPTTGSFEPLRCLDLDGDTVFDIGGHGQPYIALSGDRTGEPPCDCDDNGVLNVDDIDCFVAAFVGGNLLGADCDQNGQLNVDDIDCFVACFLAGP